LFIVTVMALFLPSIAIADSEMRELGRKLDAIAKENKSLRQRIKKLETSKNDEGSSPSKKSSKKNYGSSSRKTGVVETNHRYSYEILNPLWDLSSKPKLILDKLKDGSVLSNSVSLSGSVFAIADYQKSNTDDKFGYLMRHPTGNNQRTKEVSEAVIHSAQLALTANLGGWVTTYFELLYDPQQSFGAGTLTSLNRNQVQLRKGFVLIGDLNKSPFYLSLGKQDTPFGLMDTVNPFTNSTPWHAFGGLVYGANAGYSQDGWKVNIMGVQGGAQFRAANVPVDDTNIPSKLNNYVANLSKTFQIGDSIEALVGGSYIRGSAYCQNFPVTHFSACDEANGAFDIYARLTSNNWLLQGEYAETEDEWPGTFNPTIPQHAASKVSSWSAGGIYGPRIPKLSELDFNLSAEFSRFNAGPDGAPWEHQDQYVLGLTSFFVPSAKIFAEYIHTEGYAPLNFVSGGNLGDGVSHASSNAHSDIVLIGVNAAF
jgi:hypothetical protein